MLRLLVLIESDWNLKSSNPVMIKIGGHSINRIRLEFKGRMIVGNPRIVPVLIESDWNLKTEFKDALNLVNCTY